MLTSMKLDIFSMFLASEPCVRSCTRRLDER